MKIVICAYPGHEAQLEKIWRKQSNLAFTVKTVSENDNISSILAELVADDQVEDEFLLLPPDIIPCSPVDIYDLVAAYVYIDANGRRQYSARVPMVFEKARLIELFQEDPDGSWDDERLLKEYMTRFRNRPVEVGFKSGNFITPVLRGNPCENVVIEAFLRKKFISANPVGFEAIKDLVGNVMLK